MKRRIARLFFIGISLAQFHLIAQVNEFNHYYGGLPINLDCTKIILDKIKAFSIWEYPIQYGKVSSPGDKIYECSFDSLGKMSSEHVYYGKGGTKIFNYKRDNQGNVIKETQLDYLNLRKVDSHVNYEYSYKYDLQKRVTEMKVYEGAHGDFSYKKKYTYDSSDSLIEETEFDSNGGIVSHPIIYKYDSLKRLISKSKIGGYSFKYDHDSKGNIISCVYDYNGGPETTYIYEYYDANKIKSETSSNKQTITITNYSLSGKKISGSKTVNHDDESKSTTSYTYDSNGNLSEVKFYTLPDEMREYTKIIYSYKK